MAKLTYMMNTSLDGYTEDEHGDFGWTGSDDGPDEEVFAYIKELSAPFGTYLYGRKMYEAMSYWEKDYAARESQPARLDWARQWQAAEKIVYSSTLAEPRTARTRIEREFDPDAVRRLKADAEQDLTINGPGLAAHALRAGLVDEVHLFVWPVIVGSGIRFLPDGVRADLELVEERRFLNGVVAMRYAIRG
jgi:dihydrofolate reductase